MHDIKTRLFNLRKKQLKLVYIRAISGINNFDNSNTMMKFHKILLVLVKDLSWFYLMRMGVCVKEKQKANSYFVINYVNKFVEYIDFEKIINNKNISKASFIKASFMKASLCPTISNKYPEV